MSINASTFNNNSSHYATYRPKYPRELYENISSLCKNHNLVWDCACGNGQVAIDISEYFEKVEASDIAENQIANAFKKSNINYSIQNSEATSFPNDYFDAICIAQALHWFNLNKFFKEAKRVLKKDGIFICWGYSFFKINDDIDNLLNHFLLNKIDTFWSENNRSLHNQYNNIKFPFKSINFPRINMIENWSINRLIEYLNTWSSVKLYNEKFNTFIVNDLENELKKIWKDNETKKINMELFIKAYINK